MARLVELILETDRDIQPEPLSTISIQRKNCIKIGWKI